MDASTPISSNTPPAANFRPQSLSTHLWQLLTRVDRLRTVIGVSAAVGIGIIRGTAWGLGATVIVLMVEGVRAWRKMPSFPVSDARPVEEKTSLPQPSATKAAAVVEETPETRLRNYATAIYACDSTTAAKHAKSIPFEKRLEILEDIFDEKKLLVGLQFLLPENPTEEEVRSADGFLSPRSPLFKTKLLERAKALFTGKPAALIAWFLAKEETPETLLNGWDNTKLAAKYLCKGCPYYSLDFLQFLLNELNKVEGALPNDLRSYLESCLAKATATQDEKLVKLLSPGFMTGNSGISVQTSVAASAASSAAASNPVNLSVVLTNESTETEVVKAWQDHLLEYQGDDYRKIVPQRARQLFVGKPAALAKWFESQFGGNLQNLNLSLYLFEIHAMSCKYYCPEMLKALFEERGRSSPCAPISDQAMKSLISRFQSAVNDNNTELALVFFDVLNLPTVFNAINLSPSLSIENRRLLLEKFHERFGKKTPSSTVGDTDSKDSKC